MNSLLIVFVILYLLGTVALGFWASRRVKNAKDFILAGRRLPLLMAASVMFATWFGSETVMGAPSEFVESGLIGVIEDPFGAALCLLLVGLFFARPLYRLNILTLSDYFRIRYDQKTELISAFVLVPSYFGWIAAQLVAMGIILKVLTGMPMAYGVIGSAALVTLYTYVGGMWSVSITDFVQTLAIVLGLLILTATVVVRAGGIGVLLEAAPPDFFRFLPEPNLDDVLAYFAAWITIGLGSIPSPDVFQRTMSAKDENTAVRASYLSAGLYLTIGFLPLISALGAKVLHPELLEGDAQMVLPQMVLQYGGLGLQVLFFGAVLSAVMSTTSGAILAPASVVGENIVKAFRPDLSDAQLLKAVRFSILGITFASVIMALLKGNIYELVAASSTMSLVALFVPLTLGLYWKGARVTGAIMAIVLGTLSWLWAEFGEWGVPGLLVGLAVSLLAMLVGSFWGKKKAG